MTGVGLWATIGLLATPGGQSALPTGPMTIDQAVLIAERNAFSVQLQRTTVEIDRQAIAIALAGLGPTIGLNALFTQFGSETTASLGPGSPPIVVSPFNTTSGTASLAIPIDISGNLSRLYWASQDSYKAAKDELQSSFNDARLNARTAYLQVLRDQDLVTVAEETLKDAQGRLDQGRLEYAQQQVAKIDVDRFDAQVAQSTSDLLNAKNTLELAKQAFNDALARPIETPVNLVDVSEGPPIPTDGEHLADIAQKIRPDVKSQQQQLKALGLITRATEAGMNPALSFGLQYQRNLSPSLFSGNPNTVQMTLNLNVPLYDSGLTRAKVKTARQNEVAAKIQLDQARLGISQEVRGALTSLASAQARMANAQRQVVLADEVFRLAKVRQAAGEGTYVEVIDAESSLATARDGVVSAKYDYFQAYSQLQHGVGNDKLEDAEASPKAKKAGGSK